MRCIRMAKAIRGKLSPLAKSRALFTRDLRCWFQADVAQLVEHSLGKGEVTSSILVIGSRVRKFGVTG
jgi:hypothetical protein